VQSSSVSGAEHGTHLLRVSTVVRAEEMVCFEVLYSEMVNTLGLIYFSGIFTPERYGDMWGFGVYPILLNPLKYFFQKILYHDGEFLI
jgi:hypothetical protein